MVLVCDFLNAKNFTTHPIQHSTVYAIAPPSLEESYGVIHALDTKKQNWLKLNG